LFRLLEYLFDIRVQRNYDGLNYDTGTYFPLPAAKVSVLSPEQTSFLDTVFLGADRYSLTSLKADILGQGNNRWSNVKLAESYARALTGTRVGAKFLKNASQSTSIFTDLPASGISADFPGEFSNPAELAMAWRVFKADWLEAVNNQGSSLLSSAALHFSSAYDRVRALYSLPQLQFYCKTGTPQETSGQMFVYLNDSVYVDEGLFAFGIMNDQEPVKGVVGVVYIRHLSKKPIRMQGTRVRGVESYTARDFLTPGLLEKILFYSQKRLQ
jgi:hypothetical protein